MPAIDPGRLQREAERLQGLFASPAELARAALEVLDFYADRARRPASPLAAEEHATSLHVPAPVVRALGSGLAQQAAGNPDGGWAAAEALWRTNLREPRLLACWVLSAFADESVADWLEERTADLEDSALMSSVVERAFLRWRTQAGGGYIDRIERWLASPRGAVQALGLRALEAGLELPEAEDLHRAFQALGRLRRPVRGEAGSALADLLESLARRSPAETTHFLVEEIEAGRTGIDRLARSLLEVLPSPQQDRLTGVLSSHGRRKPR